MWIKELELESNLFEASLILTFLLQVSCQFSKVFVSTSVGGTQAFLRTYLAKEEYTEATRDFLVSTFFCFALNALLASEEVWVRTFSTF